jgi:hypothetical protein
LFHLHSLFMNNPALPNGQAAPAAVAPTYLVHRTCDSPAYCHLTLEDDQGLVGNWVLTKEIRSGHKQNMLAVLLPHDGCQGRHEWVEEGGVRAISRHRRKRRISALRSGLAQGLLQLYFSGHILNGYYRLRRLMEGSGQLWQLARIG